MVEFDSIETARKAKESLDGADIYSGCCTLKIEYAKPTRLNVPRNDQDNWDYTADANSLKSQNTDQKRGLIQQPNDDSRDNHSHPNSHFNQRPNNEDQGYYTNNKDSNENDNNDRPYFNRNNSNNSSQENNNAKPYNRYSNSNSGSNYQYNNNNPNNNYSQNYNRDKSQSNGSSYNSNSSSSSNSSYSNNKPNNDKFNNYGSSSYSTTSSNSNTKQMPSLMNMESVPVSNNKSSSNNFNNSINSGSNNTNGQILILIGNICFERMNCDKLFNFFCLYGNVDRIKFLITKEGSVMLQMNSAAPIYNVLNHLNNTYFYGKKMQIQVTKQSILNPVSRPGELKDGTPSYRDYTNSRNNRFQSTDAAQRNKPVAPANVLHWFNGPPGMDEQKVIDIFVGSGAKPPNKVKIFLKRPEKCTTGLAEWNNIADCVEALLLVNNHEISHSSSKFPFTFKLCFSATPIVD
jgi:heterogeneous nuclear ribonucleoprotein L